MIPDIVNKEFNKLIRGKEVNVPYIIECGSRAWGKENPSSDYDTYFIFVRKRYTYFQEEVKYNHKISKKDIPTVPPIDLLGLDIKCVCERMFKPPIQIVEFFHTPCIYKDTLNIAQSFREIFNEFISPTILVNNCLKGIKNMMKTNEIVLVKNYYMTLRLLGFIHYINKNETFPNNFNSNYLYSIIDNLPSISFLDKHTSQTKIRRDKELDNFIKNFVKNNKEQPYDNPKDNPLFVSKLEALFHSVINFYDK